MKEWASLPLTSPVLFKVHGILDTEIGGAAELSSNSVRDYTICVGVSMVAFTSILLRNTP